jgi:hypothetical protein
MNANAARPAADSTLPAGDIPLYISLYNMFCVSTRVINVYVHIKRRTETSPLAPPEEALAASASGMSKRSIIDPPQLSGLPPEAYLLGRLIHYQRTNLRGVYIIAE